MDFVVGGLEVDGHFFEKFTFYIDSYPAIVTWTVHLFELLDFIHGIGIETTLAETVFMLAVAHVNLTSSKFTTTDLTNVDSSQLFDLNPHHFSQLTLLPLYFPYMLLLLVMLLDCIGY